MRNLDAAAVAARLGLDDAWLPWLLTLEAHGPSLAPIRLPAPHRVSALFARLGVQPADADALLDAWPRPAHSPEWWWLLQHCHQFLVAHPADPSVPHPHHWRLLPLHLGARGRLFYVYVYLATVPAIRRWHRARGIPDTISWATLADLGEQVALHRRMFGTAGLDTPDWLALHFRGLLYRLGRLQFQRELFPLHWPIASDVPERDGVRPSPGAPALDVHIPASGGPLSPAACSASFAQARAFFARSFPEEPYAFARCTSWLLDQQLATYLPPTSNIVAFQQRFHLLPGGYPGDQDVLRFVFRQPALSLDVLPQLTTLERAIVSHLRAGQQWHVRFGWLLL